jgi:hypothetical protein
LAIAQSPSSARRARTTSRPWPALGVGQDLGPLDSAV